MDVLLRQSDEEEKQRRVAICVFFIRTVVNGLTHTEL